MLGDLAALGYDPAGALERLAALPGVHLVRGNTDRYLVTGERPPDVPAIAAAQADPRRLRQVVEVEQSFSWAQGHVTAAGWLEPLAALPLEYRLTLPDGTRLLGVHAAPGRDDGPGLRPDAADDDLHRLVSGAAAHLVCAGHTHRVVDRHVTGSADR